MIEDQTIAAVPEKFRRDGIQWLLLCSDSASGGWFLFGHSSLKDRSKWDTWHLTKKDAVEEARLDWGVQPQTWKVQEPI